MPDSTEKQLAKLGSVQTREIVEEMRTSYIDYAMSVIVARALPDVRDGLKPVHRRILFSMQEEGLTHAAKFRKSATVVGSTLGRYHPHGDISVYDAMVRMAQDFSMRYPMIDGQGNFGCFTGDTKVKLTDGRSLSFAGLVKEHKAGRRNWTFSFNDRDQKIEIAEVKNPRVTKSNAELVEVELDNGKKIKCTPDHRFMLRDGSYCEAKDLRSEDSLMPLYTKEYDGKKDKNLKGYEMMLQPFDQAWQFIHRLADDWNLQGNVYTKSAGRIRHHIDFNKHNNNPDNIRRLQWEEHWRIHYEMTSWRHKNDPEYVRKLAEGRKRFIENNRELLSARATERNRKLWRNTEYRKKRITQIKALWENKEYKEFMRRGSSTNLKRLWERKDFQALLSDLKSKEMKKRWQNQDYRAHMEEKMREFSIKLWSNPQHREYMSRLMKERTQDPKWKKRQSDITKALWKDPAYRAKYPEHHFERMAKSLWENPGMKEFHREKLLKQRQNPEFLERNREGLQQLYKERVAENPNYMKELAQKSAASLRASWTEPSYKERVMKSRILGFVSTILSKNETVTPEAYNRARTNNGIPRAEKAANYFGSFAMLIEEAKSYNHKVVCVRRLRKRENVYDITIDEWHNFALGAGIFVHNSIDGDPAAAMRYSEARMSRMGEFLLGDISKDTVDFVDNYDASRKEPAVLPSPVPQLLLNGTLGIAVGMATNIPPHNIKEILDSAVYLLDNPKATTEDLFQFVKGPDFPTGGIIYNKREILEAYSQGKGPIVVRGKVDIVEGSPSTSSGQAKRTQIIIREIPYQVNKSTLVEQFAKLVQDKKIDGIKDIRDESDREGMRIVFDLQRDAQPQKIVNRLYKFSDLQRSFHLNMIALVDGIQPKVLSLVEILQYFIDHRRQVVYRRTKYDLDRAKEREHILEGLHKCLAKIDEVIQIIRKAADRTEAQKNLMKRFKLSEIQTNAILDTRLAQLARLERQKIEDELKEIRLKIKELSAILASPKKIDSVIKKELAEGERIFGDERRTKVVVQGIGEIAEEDLIPQEEAIITLTQGGYIKRINPSTYKIQKRGGKGIMGMKTVSDDIIEHFLSAQTHDSLMLFTDSGKVFQTPVYEIPEGTRVAKGRGLLNFLEMSADDKILSLFAIGKEDVEAGVKYLVMGTKQGVVKKTPLEEFKNVRRSGLIAITLKKGDALLAVRKTTGEDEIIITTKKGQAVRFAEKDARSMGRGAAGIHGIRLKKGDEVAGLNVIVKQAIEKKDEPQYVLGLTENGYGKRTDIKEYRMQSRGGSGIKTANITEKTGELVYSCILEGDEEDLIVISRKGTVIRTEISTIPKISRSTQGVRIMKLDEGDKVASAACV